MTYYVKIHRSNAPDIVKGPWIPTHAKSEAKAWSDYYTGSTVELVLNEGTEQ